MSEKRVAIVTGGASGIGRAAALRIAKNGDRVVVADLKLEASQKTVDEIVAAGGEGLALQVDVSDKASVDKMVADTVAKYGTVDKLVNNAGIGVNGKDFLEYTYDDFMRIYNINIMGVVYCTQAVLPYLREKKYGRIVNLASSAGQTGGLFSSVPYATSKAAVLNMTKSMAANFGRDNITVNAVAPGYITTPMTTGVPYDLSAVPLGRMGEAEEVGNAIAFLVSDDASYINGTCTDVGGGNVMR